MKPCCSFVLVLSLTIFTGCAAQQPKPVATSPNNASELPSDAGWWYARFIIEHDKDKPPLWHIDALIAGEVITPAFERHFTEIRIWRVHRRAPNDEFGHVFSFIFYATPQGAESIYEDIRVNPVLTQLQSDGIITRTLFDNPANNTRPGIEDTSDKSWPLIIQRTWPALIMGASRMWLDLVGTLAATHTDEPDLVQRYVLVEKDIDLLWAENGQHAFLHHLDALFGYQPLLIRY
ncbi:MAG: hypothetical protein ACU843_11720 [Gammaproteobacteria bacterium]